MTIRQWTFADQMPMVDNSFPTDFIYHAVRDGLSIRLEKIQLESPRVKEYNVHSSDQALKLVAFEESESSSDAIGVAIVEWEQWNRRAILNHIAVDPHFRGEGVGTQLLECAIGHAKDKFARHLFAETQNTNPDAIDWYLRRGFELNGFDLTLYDYDFEDKLTYPDEFAVYFTLSL